MATSKTGRKGEAEASGKNPDQHTARTGDHLKEERDAAGPGGNETELENPPELSGEHNLSPTALPVDDRLLRLQADFDNYRKRVLREKEDLYRRANEDLMADILPVLDHIDLALAAAQKLESDQNPVTEGFGLVAEQLMTVLGKFGLTPVTASCGMEFDPNVHEAILHLPSTEIQENRIVSRTRGGYMLSNRLLRAAQVVVSSGHPEEDNQNPEA